MLPALLGGGALGAIAAALISYLTVRRQRSGHITTSEAETLWAESRAIREQQRSENEALRHELTAVNALREQEHQDVLALHERYGALEEAHRQCKEDLTILTAELRNK